VSVKDERYVSYDCIGPAHISLPHFTRILFFLTMDAEMMAAMGIAGFGKQVKKRELDPARFDKNKREQVSTAWRIIRIG
jgi:hypothetical protein